MSGIVREFCHDNFFRLKLLSYLVSRVLTRLHRGNFQLACSFIKIILKFAILVELLPFNNSGRVMGLSLITIKCVF